MERTKNIRSRSIYSKLWGRVMTCGYLFLLSLLKCLAGVSSATISNIWTAGAIALVLFAIYQAVVPLENEDEMVMILYAKANALSDTITQIGLTFIACLLCVRYYQHDFSIPSEAVVAVITGLMLLVAVIRLISVFYNSRRGV